MAFTSILSSRPLLWVPLALGLLALAPRASAQQRSISGTVTDIQDIPIADVTVTLTTGSQAGQRRATTGSQGTFLIDGLAPGTYRLVYERAGFSTVTRSGDLTENDRPLNVSVVLPIAGVITSIDVTDVAGKATASRLDIPDSDLPVQVSSIPAELLQQQAVNSMVDALKNASGVQAQRWYGIYEYYTIRGFNQSDVMLVDGLRLEGNRFNTQLNNVESVEVLKGPSSVLYGQGAVGGSINVIRKKPQATRAYDFMYRGGRFNSHQVAGGATGPIGSSNSLLYRMDASYDHSDGWRNAGADRVNVSPSLTWLMGESARVTIHQAFNRDRFDGDGGVPISITTLPNYDPTWRFSLPQDNGLVEDSQTQVQLNVNLSAAWEFRNGFLLRRTSDAYFVTEGIYGDPENNQVYREPLDFHHTRRPIQNTADVVGRGDWLGVHHTVNLGYEYRDHYYRTDVTAGDDPECTCGYWYLTIAPMNLDTLAEENTAPLDITTVFRKTYNSFQTQAVFWQDQIDLGSKVKLNLGGRYDDFSYRRHRIFVSEPSDRVGLQARDTSAYTYRAGLVYSPEEDHQLYFNTSTSFDPVLIIPPDGRQLDPQRGRNVEGGYRFLGLGGRVDVSAAVYYIKLTNLPVAVREQGSVTDYRPGDRKATGVDIDINTDLGWGTFLRANYGYSDPEYTNFAPNTGNVPRYTQRHAANAWLTKSFDSGFTASVGARYLGPQFSDDANTNRIGGWTTFSGAVGYRAEKWEWSLNADNLFNRERYFLGGHFSNLVFPGPPINVSTTIRLRFN